MILVSSSMRAAVAKGQVSVLMGSRSSGKLAAEQCGGGEVRE